MISKIEKLLQTGIEKRKLDGIKNKSQLEKIVNELYSSRGVMIITGFPVYSKEIGETDGPLGAISMAYSLMNLGKKVLIITDRYSFKIIEGLKSMLKIDIDIYDIDESRDKLENMILSSEISHLIAIERPGKATDGRYYSMMGTDITNLVSDTDYIFEKAVLKGIVTISIGDGGNELGFGNIKDYVASHVYKGNIIASKLRSDYILISSISNWGGYGIAKALGIVSGKNIIYDENMEESLLKNMVKNGAVDGCTGKNESSVDGKNKIEYLDVIKKIYNV